MDGINEYDLELITDFKSNNNQLRFLIGVKYGYINVLKLILDKIKRTR